MPIETMNTSVIVYFILVIGDEEMDMHLGMDQFKIKNKILHKNRSSTSKHTSEAVNSENQMQNRSIRITSNNPSSQYLSEDTVEVNNN